MITFKEFGEQALPPPPPPAGTLPPAQPNLLTPEQIAQQQQQQRAAQGLAVATGNPVDKVIVNPEENNKKQSTNEQFVAERVVDYVQRRKRAQSMRRRASRMKIKRSILRTRLASNEKLKQRAMRMAKQNLRKKIAGARGVKYNSLSSSEKIAIDKRLQGREAQIRNMARRMAPMVKRGEQKRLRAVQTGKSTKGVYGQAKMISQDYTPIYSNLLGENLTVEDINNLFTMYEATMGQNLKSIAGAPFRVVGKTALGVMGTGAALNAISTPQGAKTAAQVATAWTAHKLAGLGAIDKQKDASKSTDKHAANMQKQSLAQSKEVTKQQQIKTNQQQLAYDQQKSAAIGDIKKTVTKKINDYNQKMKGKSAIGAYQRVGTLPAKQIKLPNQTDTASTFIIPPSGKKKPGQPSATIVSHKEWDHEGYLLEKLEAALHKKATKYGVAFEEVKQVFETGLREYVESKSNTPHQFAMQRVNSHLAEVGLWDNIHAKRERIAKGSGEKMRKPGSKGAPTKQNFVDAQEAVQPKSPRDKFKDSLKKHGYDADKGADRLLALIAKQKKEREEHEKKYAHLYSEASEPTVADKIVNAGVAARKAVSDVASNFRPFDEKSYQDRVKMKKQASSVTKEDMDIHELKSLTLAKYASKVREKLMNDKVDPGKKDKRKAGLDKANFKIKFGQTNESIDESFIVDRASGYSGVFTAKDLGIKMQGGFELHPSVMEEGGAGDIGTDKLTNKYKKDTPGEAVEAFVRMMRAKRKANTQC